MISLHALNALPDAAFVTQLANVFEHSPWVPQRVAAQRPFTSALHLHQAMHAAVLAARVDEQLALIRAHPELAGRAAIRGELTSESTREQAGAGLSACSAEEFTALQTLNGAYAQKFGFPFVLAVKGHSRTSVIATLRQRVDNSVDHERMVALREIGRIAAFRIADLVSEPLGNRIIAMCELLAQHSEHATGLTCSYLSPAHRATAAQLRDWMLAAGLTVSEDAVGNVIGEWRSEQAEAATLVTGSHYDTVINAGKYDGRLGIVLPIVVIAQLRRSGATLPFHLKVIGFAEEEGVRFNSTFLGSRAVTGHFDMQLLESLDQAGISLRAALQAVGLNPDDIAKAAFTSAPLGFIEVHIEQGPVLLSEAQALGVVTAIAGSVRQRVSITGLAGHSGTVPMPLRRDAAAAAAEIVLAVERICSGKPGLVGTVGQLHVPDGAINVIPGRCELSIDIRAGDDATRDAAVTAVAAELERIATQRGVDISSRKVLQVDCAPCAPQWQQRLNDSIARLTGAYPARHLPSGAGHDAMMMARMMPVGMLFVRCGNGGISHHPDETLSVEDADLAARVFTDFLQTLVPYT